MKIGNEYDYELTLSKYIVCNNYKRIPIWNPFVVITLYSKIYMLQQINYIFVLILTYLPLRFHLGL